MNPSFLAYLSAQSEELRTAGLYKPEHVLSSAQDAVITLEDGSRVINLCANNYLGLANSEHLSRAAIEAIGTHGYGMASVRFICGTQSVHK